MPRKQPTGREPDHSTQKQTRVRRPRVLPANPAGWPRKEWCEQVGISYFTFSVLKVKPRTVRIGTTAAERMKTKGIRRNGGKELIIEAPAAYLARVAALQEAEAGRLDVRAMRPRHQSELTRKPRVRKQDQAKEAASA